MTEEILERVNFRMKKASDTLEAARLLIGKGNTISTVNRIYYAVFYAVSAVLLSRGFSSSKHSGIISLFNKEIVNNGLVDKTFGRFFNQLFFERQEGDYGDFAEFDSAEVQSWLELAEKFISDLRRLIESDRPKR
jgi:hypothetical protein